MEWNPTSFFKTDAIPANPFAILILNQPINEKAFDAVRRHACYILLADGGANRYYELMKSRSRENTDLPSCILGDLDSIKPSVRTHYTTHKVPILYDPDQDSTDFTKCIRFLRVHAHAIMAHENPVLSDNHDLYMTSFSSSKTKRKNGGKLDVLVLGGLGGRVDQGFSQIHHLYAAHMQRREELNNKKNEEGEEETDRFGELYLLSEESLSFILPPGRNIIHTPFTHQNLQKSNKTETETEDRSENKNEEKEKEEGEDGEDRYILAENVGIIPLSGPTSISLTGFEWDVSNWKTEIGGQLSTSNHIRESRIEVVVDSEVDRSVLFTVELGKRYKKGSS